ncbi:hypothetical protein [Streptococcus halichoeri]|uniref:hypothetical protein n=1 Tax=Streptococcus halichoeri TaxID=254785 RepID=UPI00135BD6E6|nr:hypothetical protein [Streptococcus halichoeri]
MIDTFKVKWFKRGMSLLALILVFFLGLGFGQMGNSSRSKDRPKQTATKKTRTNTITQTQIKSFLVAYYTKKDLEENRNRYKDYMTEGLYNATISEENKAQNQAYKGFVVNFEFQDANIYIDQVHKQVICEVTYTNDLLQKKNNKDGAQIGVVNHTTIQLAYTKLNGKYLINQMSTILLTDSANPSEPTESYGAIAPSNTKD